MFHQLADFGLARAKSVPTKTYSNEVIDLCLTEDIEDDSISYHYHVPPLGGDLVVSSTRCAARFHRVLHPDRHVGRRLHFLRNGFWSTSLPGIHGRNLFNHVLFISCALSNSRWFVFGEMLLRREQPLWITSFPCIELQNIQNLDWSPKTMEH